MQSLNERYMPWAIKPPFNTLEVVCQAAQIQAPPQIHEADLVPEPITDLDSPCRPSDFVGGLVTCMILDLDQQDRAWKWSSRWKKMEVGDNWHFVLFSGGVVEVECLRKACRPRSWIQCCNKCGTKSRRRPRTESVRARHVIAVTNALHDYRRRVIHCKSSHPLNEGALTVAMRTTRG